MQFGVRDTEGGKHIGSRAHRHKAIMPDAGVGPDKRL
jgi:hypothetical protein